MATVHLLIVLDKVKPLMAPSHWFFCLFFFKHMFQQVMLQEQKAVFIVLSDMK